MSEHSRSRKLTVTLTAVTNEGRIVFHSTMSIGEWYDGNIPIIDSAKVRAEANIVAVAGERYDEFGELYERWRNEYAPDGRLVAETIWDRAGVEKHTTF